MVDVELEVLRTSDLTLACTLLSLGHDIIGVDKSNIRRVTFIFKMTSDLEVLLQNYWVKKVMVVPQDFAQAIQNVKALIHTDYEK